MTLRNGTFLGLVLLIALVITGGLYLLLPTHESPASGSPIVAATTPPVPSVLPALPTAPSNLPSPRVEKAKDGVYVYNERGQLGSITYSDGSVYMYSYDAYGDKIREGSGPGKTWTYIYDADHHLVSVIDPQGKVTH